MLLYLFVFVSAASRKLLKLIATLSIVLFLVEWFNGPFGAPEFYNLLFLMGLLLVINVISTSCIKWIEERMSKLEPLQNIIDVLHLRAPARLCGGNTKGVIRVPRSPVWPESYKVTRQHQGLTLCNGPPELL